MRRDCCARDSLSKGFSVRGVLLRGSLALARAAWVLASLVTLPPLAPSKAAADLIFSDSGLDLFIVGLFNNVHGFLDKV